MIGRPSVRFTPGVKRQHLERNVSLVVIKRHDGVEFFALFGRERRVRHQRAFNVNAALAGRFHRRLDKIFLFAVAKKPVFARVRIQAADAQRGSRCKICFIACAVSSMTFSTRSTESFLGTS
jgi:hypothetical protein